MKTFIKHSILFGSLVFLMGGFSTSLTLPVHAEKVDSTATKQYQNDVRTNRKTAQKLAGKNNHYATYTFKLSKFTNAYYLHWSNHQNDHQVIGKTLLPKGTIVYANKASANGIEWDVKTNHVHLSQGVSMTMVLTNQNARPIAGNYHEILEETVRHLK